MKLVPFTVQIDRKRENITAVVTGDLYASDFRLLRQELLADPAFDPGYSLLMNLTGVSHLHMTATDIADIAKSEILSLRGRQALVASNPQLLDLISEFQTHNGIDYTIAVFHSTYHAREWLGLK